MPGVSRAVDGDAERELFQYRCLVGHLYSAHSLLQAHFDAQESVLWAAVVALEETGNLVKAVASQFPPPVAEHLKRQVARKPQQAAALRAILQELEPFHLE